MMKASTHIYYMRRRYVCHFIYFLYQSHWDQHQTQTLHCCYFHRKYILISNSFFISFYIPLLTTFPFFCLLLTHFLLIFIFLSYMAHPLLSQLYYVCAMPKNFHFPFMRCCVESILTGSSLWRLHRFSTWNSFSAAHTTPHHTTITRKWGSEEKKTFRFHLFFKREESTWEWLDFVLCVRKWWKTTLLLMLCVCLRLINVWIGFFYGCLCYQKFNGPPSLCAWKGNEVIERRERKSIYKWMVKMATNIYLFFRIVSLIFAVNKTKSQLPDWRQRWW